MIAAVFMSKLAEATLLAELQDLHKPHMFENMLKAVQICVTLMVLENYKLQYLNESY